jgi:peptidoglycan/LPS O-acetylase OafA/YrhL
MKPSVSYIPSLDGIRAISFFLVFVAHAGLQKIVPPGLGVTVFFFLSGYLITTLLRVEYDRNQDINLKFFYLRRIIRIFPPFYLILALATGLTILGAFPSREAVSLPAVLSQIFYYANYWNIWYGVDQWAPGSEVYWSLAVEEHFYLAFPIFYLWLRQLKLSGKQQALIFWGLCLLILIWRCVLSFGFDVTFDRTYRATDTRLDSLLFGCALAVYGNPVLDRQDISVKPWRRIGLPVAIATIFLSLVIRQPEFRETLRYSLQGLALYPIFIVASCQPMSAGFQWLNLAWVQLIGKMSYSLYLLHYTVILGLKDYFPKVFLPMSMIAGMTISIAIALIIYYLVEVPCAKLRKRYVS